MALENPAACVRVTNKNNTWLVVDRFGGIEYKFPPGESVTVAAEVAEHIFGYGLDEKERFKKFLRMGIANLKHGAEMWKRIEVKPMGNIVATGAVREAA